MTGVQFKIVNVLQRSDRVRRLVFIIAAAQAFSSVISSESEFMLRSFGAAHFLRNKTHGNIFGNMKCNP